MTLKYRDVEAVLRADGWYPLPRTGTSHRHFKHPSKPGRVTLAGEPGEDIDPKSLGSVIRQAQLERKDFLGKK
ncbi:MAG TPA: type II toxin-antitoxin system HicA family toxin [bacterium]|nr:type II toxin-antitoxin system HicA family toxin [bacterium]